jgi:hypothetical protein
MGALASAPCCVDADLAAAACRHRKRLRSTSAPLAKRVWVVQAAESADGNDVLTAKGVAGARALRSHPLLRAAMASESGSGAELVVVAPTCRALSTMRCAMWRWAMHSAPGVPVIVHPDLHADEACLAAELLLAGWPDAEERIDTSAIDTAALTHAATSNSSSSIALRARLRMFQSWLIERSERTVVLVGDGAALRALLGVQFEDNECRELLLHCTRAPPMRWQPVSPLDSPPPARTAPTSTTHE